MNIQPFTVSIPFHTIASHMRLSLFYLFVFFYYFIYHYYRFSSLITKPFRFYCITFKISVFIQIKKAGAHKRQPYIIACWTSNHIHLRILTLAHSQIQTFKHSSNHALSHSHTHNSLILIHVAIRCGTGACPSVPSVRLDRVTPCERSDAENLCYPCYLCDMKIRERSHAENLQDLQDLTTSTLLIRCIIFFSTVLMTFGSS